MTKLYLAAMAKSFQSAPELRISAYKLDGIFETPLGSQPCGISCSGDTVLFADYFFPAITLLKVVKDNIDDLVFHVSHIRGVMAGNESVRLWPDILQGANRCQTAGLAPDGSIWINRNGSPKFAILTPPADGEEKWKYAGEKSLPDSDGRMVQSALFDGEELLVIQSRVGAHDNWEMCRYEIRGENLIKLESKPIPGFRYGIAIRHSRLYTVTNQMSREKHGIYCDGRLVVPGVCGNGVCFLPDGSALVSRYGWVDKSPLGQPGALIYIPANFF